MTECQSIKSSAPMGAEEVLHHVVNPHIIDCPLGDGLALFDGRSGEYFSLNGTAALMWQAAHHPVTSADLLSALRRAQSLPDNDGAIRRDMDNALRQFIDMGLFIPASSSHIAHGE